MFEYNLFELTAANAADLQYPGGVYHYDYTIPPVDASVPPPLRPVLTSYGYLDYTAMQIKDTGAGHVSLVPADGATYGNAASFLHVYPVLDILRAPVYPLTLNYCFEWDMKVHVSEHGVNRGIFSLMDGIPLDISGLAASPIAAKINNTPLSEAFNAGEWRHFRLEIHQATSTFNMDFSLYEEDTLIVDHLNLYTGSFTNAFNIIVFQSLIYLSYDMLFSMEGASYLICANHAFKSSVSTSVSFEDNDYCLPYTRINPLISTSDSLTIRPSVTLTNGNLSEVTGYSWESEDGTALGEDRDLTVTEAGTYQLSTEEYWAPLESSVGGVRGLYVLANTEEDFCDVTWSTGATAVREVTVTEPGTYTVTVTNALGSASASITVNLPTTETDYDRIFRGDPVPEGAWLFGQSNEYRTGIATVQSQYSASPRILALAGMYWDMLNPGSEIQTMLDDMLNPSTARGYGLDVWGRIVGIKRATVPVSGEYLAFDPDPLSNPDGDSWNNAPFNPLTPQGLATDTVFRVYVMVKAMMNIGNGSLADINKYFSLMFPDSGIQVIHAGTMIIRVLDYDAVLTDAALMALRSIDWVPAGVGWQVWQGEPDCFGFLGSELQPFDQAPFIADSALIFE